MQEIEPLSPSEAARIVSEQRWSHGEAQERETSGTPEPELKDGYGVKGVEQGLGYRDMAMAYPVKTPEEQAHESADILKAVEGQPAETPVVVERKYQEIGGDHHGRDKPPHEVVSLDQASHDLGLIRSGEAQTQEAIEAQQLADAIDALRAEDPRPTATASAADSRGSAAAGRAAAASSRAAPSGRRRD